MDDDRFLTSLSNTVWMYSKAAVQQDVTGVTSSDNLNSQGNWFWVFPSSNNQLSVFKVGASASPAATYQLPGLTRAIPSGTSIGVFSEGAPMLSVIDLSGAAPSKTDYTTPITYQTTFSSVSSSKWATTTASCWMARHCRAHPSISDMARP